MTSSTSPPAKSASSAAAVRPAITGCAAWTSISASPDYWRVRLGIGHPGDKNRVTGYVLSDFAKEDLGWLLPCLDAVADEAALLAEQKPEEFMTRVAAPCRRARSGGAKNGL